MPVKNIIEDADPNQLALKFIIKIDNPTVTAVHIFKIFGSLLQSEPVEARISLIMMIVIIAVHECFFVSAKISWVGRNNNFHILIFMKDSSLTFGRSKSFYRDTDWNTLMTILAAGVIGHGRVAAKALMEKPFINNAVQLFNG